MGSPHGVGIVGLGVISRAYLETLRDHPAVRIVAVADLDEQRARSVAAEIPGARAMSVAELVADPAVDTVLNLTVPAAHAEVAHAAIAAGKDVYGEKPLAATLPEALDMVDAARRAGVRLGCAPDTVLGTGVQTARAAVDAGRIGTPVSATATWISPGHEHWHPHPDFYYLPGGGPLLDMGPYYLTALVQLLGPVAALTGMSSRVRSERTIGSGPRAGEVIPVETDTHVTGVLQHGSGATSTVTVSFDGVYSAAPPIEVHGTAGSLIVPDPNLFGGDVELRAAAAAEPAVLPPAGGFVDAGRGVGLLDFVRGGDGAGGDVALHVLEIMTALLDSHGTRVELPAAADRPAAVPLTPVEVWRAP